LAPPRRFGVPGFGFLGGLWWIGLPVAGGVLVTGMSLNNAIALWRSARGLDFIVRVE